MAAHQLLCQMENIYSAKFQDDADFFKYSANKAKGPNQFDLTRMTFYKFVYRYYYNKYKHPKLSSQVPIYIYIYILIYYHIVFNQLNCKSGAS